jgi:hypothetical protein
VGHLHRIGHHADQIRRVDDIECVVGEFEIRRIHLEEADVADGFAGGAVACDLQHRAAEVDADDRAVRRVERQVDPGADADFEDALPGLDVHAFDRLEPAGMQRRSKGDVVDLGQLVVDALDEIVFDSGDRQGARCRIRPGNELVRGVDFAIE